MVAHIQIATTTTSDNVELLSDIFSEHGALSVSMTDAKDEPLFQLNPEDNPHWQQTTLHALFDSLTSPDHIVSEIKKNYPQFLVCDFFIEKIDSKNWVLETQKQFQPQQFSQLWICPQQHKQDFLRNHKNALAVFIEPGLAFGTGTHPTTQLCLTWLANHVERGVSVIDYGCGSGILALAACALGAKTVYATDHDEQALEATENNAKYNQFKTTLHIVTTEDAATERAEIVVANILANPLIELASTLTNLTLPDGMLVLSGILEDDADRVFSAYAPQFTRINTQQQDGWVLMVLQRLVSER